MNNHSICFCMCVRNVEKDILQVLKKINELSHQSKGPNHLIIYTNDNTDNTLELLKSFEFDFIDDYHLITEEGLMENGRGHIWPDNHEIIARGKNHIMAKACEIDSWEYMVMLEGTSLNYEISGFSEVLNDSDNWDYVSAFQDIYYDYFNLITKDYGYNLCNYSTIGEICEPEIDNYGGTIGTPRTLKFSNYTLLKRFKNLTTALSLEDLEATDYHEVISAYGGLCIFKKELIEYAITNGVEFSIENSTNTQKSEKIYEMIPFLRALPFRKYISTKLRNGPWPRLSENLVR